MMQMKQKRQKSEFNHRRTIIPGFNITLGFTVIYISLILLIPLAMLFLKAATLSWQQIWQTVADPRVVTSYRLSIVASLLAALVNGIFGLLLAWVLTRYQFPARKLIDAIIDLPFAMPTAVAGITLTTLYSTNGWFGRLLEPLGIKVSYTPLGIIVVLTFIGLPFVVRTVQPVLQDFDQEVEEAALSLGANRWQLFIKVILPTLFPSWLTGVALAFARGLGEYGSVVFISGNMPYKTEITPLIIVTKLEQFDYAGAAAIATVLLLVSFLILLTINLLQWWNGKKIENNIV